MRHNWFSEACVTSRLALQCVETLSKEDAMGKTKRGYLAVYGNIKIKKLFCKECQQFALIVKKRYACCGKNEDYDPQMWKRECM